MKLQAVLFDAYGTLFDVYSVSALGERLFPGQGAALAQQWRDKQIEYTRLVTMSAPDDRHYRPFWQLTRAGLRWAAARLQLELTAEAEDALMQQYLRLTPFPENLAVLQALNERGIASGILSNGDPGMLGPVVAHAGFDSLLNHQLSVDTVRRFKTHPDAYAMGPAAFGLPPEAILFVSSNCWDAVGATWYGYTTLWINRAGAPLEELDTRPTHVGHSLADVLTIISTD